MSIAHMWNIDLGRWPRRLLQTALVPLLAVGVGSNAAAAPPELKPHLHKNVNGRTVVELHQTACQFKQAESDPVTYRASSTADCQRINRASLPIRQPGFRLLRLPAGRYVFRIYNDDVPYDVGFQLRGAWDPSLPKLTGAGIKAGTGKDFVVDLKPGRYHYACPLNPTPKYPLLVEGSASKRSQPPPRQ